MKFKKVYPKVRWSKERTKERISSVQADIDNYNRELSKIDKEIRLLLERRKQQRIAISNKAKYQNLLEKQLLED